MSEDASLPSMGITVFAGLTVLALATQQPPETMYADPQDSMGSEFMEPLPEFDVVEAAASVSRASGSPLSAIQHVGHEAEALLEEVFIVIDEKPTMSPKPWRAVVNGNLVRLRDTPSSSGIVLSRFDRGAEAWVYAQTGNWLWIRVGSEEGWMFSRYLDTLDPQ
ncbi:MAG: SH3 domain-containing protein [Marinovum sp.]|nr:SH3 domain-containing protein [Marinovum sp.]